MRRRIALLLLIACLATGAGCSSSARTTALSQAQSELPTSARRAARVVESTPVPSQEIVVRPTFSIAPVEIREVSTPVPVFQDSTAEEPQESEIMEPVVPDEEDMFPGQLSPTSEPEPYTGRTISLRFYDMASQKPVEVAYPISSDATPETVVVTIDEALRGILAQQSVPVSSVTYEDGALTVDFDPAIYEAGLSSGDETQILQSIADTYLVNVDGIRAVYYLVGGEPYRSEHVQLEGNEPYKELLGARQ